MVVYNEYVPILVCLSEQMHCNQYMVLKFDKYHMQNMT